jgi:hypothetical protein
MAALLLAGAILSVRAQSWSENGLAFNGVNNAMLIGGAPIAPPWTLELWVNRQNSSAYSAVLLADNSTAVKLEQYNFTRKVGFTQFGVADYVFNYTAPIGAWVHLAFVGTPNSTLLYANGILQGTIAASIDLPLNMFGNDKTSDHLNGIIDEVRVWNVARTQAQIQANMNKPLSAPQANLVAYWQFNKAEGNYAADSSGNNLTGTLTNSPGWVPTSVPTVTVVGFEDLPFGAIVTDQYQSLQGIDSPNYSCTNLGVYFPPYGQPNLPCGNIVSSVPSGEAQSGNNVLSLLADCGIEFLAAYTSAQFVNTVNQVGVYAGFFDGSIPANDTAQVVLTA